MTCPHDTVYHSTLPLGSDPALRRRYMVVDEPMQGNMRFGLLLEILDKVAEETALRYVRQFHPTARVVTAAIDNIVVRHAVDVTRDLMFAATINQVGRSSLEIGIRVEQPGEPALHIASCYFTMVARSGYGEDVANVPLPPLDYLDPIEKQRAGKAMARREEYRYQQAARSEPPDKQEYELLTALHQAQDDRNFSGILCARLVAGAWERTYLDQENVPFTIFGGYLVHRAYDLASICSEMVTPHRSIIAGVNRINFFHPVRMSDKLHFTARVVYTEDCYVCVETGIERTSRDRTTKALSNSCLFTFVNVDAELCHHPVPPVHPTTYAEDGRFLAARRSLHTLLRNRTLI
ncbi:MAG: acyl-CoA thioesterase [Desulfobulbus sp.]|nr:acyl-CoA thioesterase [Desulfobulbus sp.]